MKDLTKEPKSCVPNFERYLKNQNPFWRCLIGVVTLTRMEKDAWQAHPYSWWSVVTFSMAVGFAVGALVILSECIRRLLPPDRGS